MSTSQQASVHAKVDGSTLPGEFTEWSGGDAKADVKTYRSGGMGPLVSYGAKGEFDDVKITRAYEIDRDHDLIHRLRTRTGIAPMEVSVQPMTYHDPPVATHHATIYHGRLQAVSVSDVDGNKTDVRTFELTMNVTSVTQ